MSRLRRAAAWVRGHWRGIAALVLAVVLLVVGGFVWYFSNPHHAQPEQLDRATERDDVSVARDHGGYVIDPADRPDDVPRVGLIFYPGGRVHPDAYVPSLVPIAAEANVTVVVPKVRLNLAVLDRNRAAEIMNAHPEIDRWYVGGHSLGGSMACRFAGENADRVEGVVLFASYCDRDVSGTGLDVLSVTGAADAVLDRNSYENNRENLPDDAVTVELEGVNHSQFGAYVGQRGGQPSGTDFATAHERLADVVVPWFATRTEAADPGADEAGGDDAGADQRRAREDLLARATARDDVAVERTDDGGYVVAPADRPADGPRVGLVFYTGGRVHPDAYVPSLARIAARADVTVYVPKFPGNLAVVDQGRAGEVIDAHPEIDRWYVGGHSLGGSMACRFANANPDRVAGLVLFASYCDRDVSGTDLSVLSVTGAEDVVLNREAYERRRSNLPADAVHVALRGVNHSQFGAYVGQPDGQPSGTAFETAHERLANVVVPWFENRTATATARDRRVRAPSGASEFVDGPSGGAAVVIGTARPVTPRPCSTVAFRSLCIDPVRRSTHE